MSGDVKHLIRLQGTEMTISRNTAGAEDSRGFPARVYADLPKKEKILLKRRRVDLARSLGGDVEEGLMQALFLPDTQAQRGDVIYDADGNRYEVRVMKSRKLFRFTSHKIADVKQLEEG